MVSSSMNSGLTPGLFEPIARGRVSDSANVWMSSARFRVDAVHLALMPLAKVVRAYNAVELQRHGCKENQG